MENDIYKLKLHECIKITTNNLGLYNIYITRVPGGWIYKYDGKDVGVFIPFNNEFMNKDNNIIKNTELDDYINKHKLST